MKVLVVDDSRSDRKVIRFNFEWHGCQVFEASNGRQGLEIAAAEKPDLIISDCLMPIMDGFQFLHELKKNPDLQSIPFVFYSSVYTGSKEADLALAMGARAFLEKPKGPDELWEEVGRALTIPPSQSGGGDETLKEEEFLRNYCQIVAGKLEERVRDLSDANESLRRLNEELEKRVMERTGQLDASQKDLEIFSYSVSHDLRAPLRHIDGFSQALSDEFAEKLNSTGNEYLERIQKSCRRMFDMIDGLLELSRAGRAKVLKDNVDLTALALEVGGELAKLYPERQVELLVPEKVEVKADYKMMKTVLEKLLANSWAFTAPVEQPRVELFVTEWDGRPAYAVRDNGVGFDPTYAEKLFAPFQRLHSQQEFPGVGMGLAIVKRIVNKHGGEVKAEAEPNRGATVTFTL
ncbi:hypothetical protein GMSM_33160 [Geomonas sp. Red276]